MFELSLYDITLDFLKMPGKIVKKILEEVKLNDEDSLRLVDQGIVSILEIPEICIVTVLKYNLEPINHININYQ